MCLLVALQCSSQLTNKVQITLTFKKLIMLMSMKALTSSTLILEVSLVDPWVNLGAKPGKLWDSF